MTVSILNIVFGCPEREGPDDPLAGEPRALASFYAEMLGLRLLREDWAIIGTDRETVPRLAFGDGPADYRAPRWPDPEFPQQLHLDITVPDLDAAEELALARGASRLQDQGHFRSYADPVGHPFCLYAGDPASESARVERVVFDCFSPRSLAAFYQELLAMTVRTEDSAERVVIGKEDGSLPMLGFQHAPRYKPPRWPDPEYPEQIHLDLDVEDGAEAGALAERLGAIRLPEMGGSCPVYADPAGHPFCMCGPGQ